ncbi:MAG: phosphotransferase [Acidimicrobiia bacterium]
MIDPSLPGFEETWEPGRALELLNRVLDVEPGWEVVDLALDRIRHSPGIRGIVHYRGHLGDGSDLQEFWIAGSVYSDGRSLAHAHKLAHCPSALGPSLRSLVAFDSFFGMLWQVFPLDRRLPDLHRAYSNPTLLGADSLHPVRHRLGLSATVKIAVEGQSKYAKFHRQGEAVAALERGRLLAKLKSTGFSLPEAVEGLEATVTSGMTGVSLDRHPAIGDLVARLAAHLTELHALSPVGLEDVSGTPARRAHRAVDWLRLVLPELDPLITKLVNGPWPEGGDQLVHGDLKPDHVFISQGELRMIDVDSAGRGRGLSDLAQLFVRLANRDAAERFRDDYFAIGVDKRGWSGELAMASLQLALFYAQHRPPDWRLMVERIMESAATAEVAGSVIEEAGDCAGLSDLV